MARKSAPVRKTAPASIVPDAPDIINRGAQRDPYQDEEGNRRSNFTPPPPIPPSQPRPPIRIPSESRFRVTFARGAVQYLTADLKDAYVAQDKRRAELGLSPTISRVEVVKE